MVARSKQASRQAGGYFQWGLNGDEIKVKLLGRAIIWMSSYKGNSKEAVSSSYALFKSRAGFRPSGALPASRHIFISPDVGLVLFGLNGLARKCMGERMCRGHPVSINKQLFEELLCIGHAIDDKCMCVFIRLPRIPSTSAHTAL